MSLITDSDISNIEKKYSLLFDEGSKDFIKCNINKNIKACPGAGKTTSLVAKLDILTSKMPFVDKSGILVLTHTNIAIEEIKRKLGCNSGKLLSYPNHVGTFQSFVNKYLAIPFYVKCFEKKPIAIDSEIFEKKLTEFMKRTFEGKFLLQRCEENLMSIENFIKSLEVGGKKIELNINGRKKTIVNNSSSFYPRLASYIEDDIILKILEKGYLTFSHCYDFAEEYLQSYPDIVNIISARFKYIFIDETQDTNERQFKLLDTLFGNSDSIVQKIGDNDQSIFNFESKDIETWDIGDNYIKINNTKRLSQKICKVASDFSITNYRLESESQIDIHPIIIVFDDERINEVLPVFAAKIKLYNLDLIDNSFFKAIGGVSQRKVKHTIPSYIDYHRKESLEEVDENNLKDKLLKSKCDLTPYFINNIYWEIILQYLDILNIRNEVGKYTKNSLSNYLKINQKKLLDQLKLNSIYMVDSIFSESDPFLYLEKSIIDLADFMEFSYDCNTLKSIIFNHKVGNPKKNSDKVTINIDGSDIDIHISTIHKSKGETHTATLVMETYNRAYDFNQLLPLLKGKKLNKFSAKKKLLYVGMTRPTHLLCLALHKSYLKSSGNRVTLNESDFEQMKLNGFEVIVLD